MLLLLDLAADVIGLLFPLRLRVLDHVFRAETKQQLHRLRKRAPCLAVKVLIAFEQAHSVFEFFPAQLAERLCAGRCEHLVKRVGKRFTLLR